MLFVSSWFDICYYSAYYLPIFGHLVVVYVLLPAGSLWIILHIFLNIPFKRYEKAEVGTTTFFTCFSAMKQRPVMMSMAC